MSVLESW